jgi:nucleotide-binding universal stress UspA family protein
MKTIVCGTDLSDPAARAARAAAAIAKRLGATLELVHVIDELGAELTVASDQTALYDPLRKRVREHAEELRTRFGIDVEPTVVPGSADEKLIEIALATGASLLVVATLGAKKQHRWLLGSVAERVAQASPLPVLVVRDGAGIEAWARGDRSLRIMVGVDLGSSSRAALRWAASLRAVGPCDLLLAQLAWPLEGHIGLGAQSAVPLHQVGEGQEPLLRDLRAWAGDLPGEGETTFTVSAGWGRLDAHLTQLAAEAKVDMLVVGTHQRAGVARLWQGSVSRGVLHHASCSVACVPRNATGEAGDGILTRG